MGYQTTIIDGERVLHPLQKQLAEKLIWRALVPYAGTIDRVVFRINTFIGENFQVQYLMQMNVKLTSSKRVVVDTTSRNRQAGIRFLTDEIQHMMSREAAFENRLAASFWTGLARRFRANFHSASLSREKAMT